MNHTPPPPSAGTSTGVVIGALVVVCLFALAGVLFVSEGDESLQRLGLLFGLLATAATALVAMIRADTAANRLNGGLDDRISAAVLRANADRRASDVGTAPAPWTAEPSPPATSTVTDWRDDPGPAGTWPGSP